MNECIFEFKHPHRCRDRCNLWIEDGAADLCIWHREGAPPASFDIRSVLLKVISASDHWLEGANLEASDLSELDLTGAKLPNANLADCNLKGTILDAALLESASLISANLTGSSLVGTSLRAAVLTRADATNAHLEGADLSAASLEGFKVAGAYLHALKLSPETLSYGFEIGLPREMLECNFKSAASVFRDLSKHFRDVSDHQRSEHHYHLEMTALHLHAVNATKNPIGSSLQRAQIWLRTLEASRPMSEWLPWAMHRWIWGYGARPFRTLIWMLAVVLFFGVFIFPIIGVELRGGIVSRDVLQCLTLSLVNFASLGSAIRVPHGLLGDALAGSEAMLGVVLTSLFVVALATRYVHRP